MDAAIEIDCDTVPLRVERGLHVLAFQPFTNSEAQAEQMDFPLRGDTVWVIS